MKKIYKILYSNFSASYNDWKEYHDYFGNIGELILTPYFLFAVLFSAICNLFCSDLENNSWYSYALGGLPSLLGFSIGGYAIIITFGDSDFRKFLATEYKQKNFFLIINGTFIHFIIIQAIAFFCALVAQRFSIENCWGNFFLSIPFYYSFVLTISVAFNIKSISKWYVNFLKS